VTAGSLAQPIAQLLAYWKLVVKYKWHILVETLGLTLAFTVIIAKLPNVYEATTTILVDPQQIPEKYVSTVVTADPYSRLNTITQQVLSRTCLQEILDRLNLYPELRKSVSTEELIERMRDDITIQVKQGSGPELSTFTITYQGKQPVSVAEVTNELAVSFIQWNVNSREGQVAGTKEFLASELENAKRDLQRQEEKLRTFKMAHLGETPDQAQNNLQVLAGLRSAFQANVDTLNRLDAEKVLLTNVPESIPAGANPDVALTERGRIELEKRQLEATIQKLREHYSDRYPEVVRATHRLDEINARLKSFPPDPVVHKPDEASKQSATEVRLGLINKEMERLKDEQNRTQSQIAAYQKKIDAVPLREEQLVELTRNYDISKANYQALLDKSFSIGMAADLEQKQKGERFTVLDPAQVPQKQVKPNRKKLIPLSALFAFGLSILSVLVKETLSPAIKTEIELKSLLPVSAKVIGLIPRIEIAADARRERRLAIFASLVCILLCLTLIRVIWQIRMVL